MVKKTAVTIKPLKNQTEKPTLALLGGLAECAELRKPIENISLSGAVCFVEFAPEAANLGEVATN
jgi:hypothetical protein